MFLIDTCLCPLTLRDEHETPALFEKSNMTFDELLRTRKETENNKSYSFCQRRIHYVGEHLQTTLFQQRTLDA